VFSAVFTGMDGLGCCFWFSGVCFREILTSNKCNFAVLSAVSRIESFDKSYIIHERFIRESERKYK
jgi:hypothetical protein